MWYKENGTKNVSVIFQSRKNYYYDNINRIRFSQEEIHLIRKMLVELEHTNDKIRNYMKDNSYNYIKVIKTFHTDANESIKSTHFNILFKNQYTESKVFHIYCDLSNNTITGVVSQENMLQFRYILKVQVLSNLKN